LYFYPNKEEELTIEQLQESYKNKAAIFAELIQGKFKVKGLTSALVKEAFPDINL
jgi:hypothetical protein